MSVQNRDTDRNVVDVVQKEHKYCYKSNNMSRGLEAVRPIDTEYNYTLENVLM